MRPKISDPKYGRKNEKRALSKSRTQPKDLKIKPSLAEFDAKIPDKYILSSEKLNNTIPTVTDAISTSDSIKGAIRALGLTELNPMQKSIMNTPLTRPILVASETGSGKTLAYLLPIIQALKHEESIDPTCARSDLRALILLPSNELVDQVYSVAKMIAHFAKLTIRKYCANDHVIEKGDLLISTPSLLHAAVLNCPPAIPSTKPFINKQTRAQETQKRSLNMENIKFLVIDEADSLLVMDPIYKDGFGDHIQSLVKKMPNLNSTIFSSATIPKSLRPTIHKIFALDGNESDRSLISWSSPALHCAQKNRRIRFIDCRREGAYKLEKLTELLNAHDGLQTLIFCNSTKSATKLHRMMQDPRRTLTTIPSLVHGRLPEKQRKSIFSHLKEGNVKSLICTDLASRGLDTLSVDHVILFDFPRNGIDFIHRVGRTGRMIGRKRGLVHCLLLSKDIKLATRIKSCLNKNLPITK